MKKCDLCNSTNFEEVLIFPSRSMTSDSRIVDISLEKVQCIQCGLITNKNDLDEKYLNHHYENEYQLGIAANQAEPMVYLEEGTTTRSEIIFNWIDNSISKKILKSKNIFEIGCSDGKILNYFKSKYKNLKEYGIDLSKDSISIALKNNLNVECKAIEQIDRCKTFDIIYSVAVVEHVQSPNDFFKYCHDLLSDDGSLIVIQPSQDVRTHDIFFSDHLYHFSNKHMNLYGRKNGFKMLEQSFGNDCFVLSHYKKGDIESLNFSISEYKNENIYFYSNLFSKIDNWIENNDSSKIAVWGVGEVYTLLKTYCKNIELIDKKFDDNVKRYIDAIEPTIENIENHKGYKFLLTFKPNSNKIFKQIDYISIYDL